MNAYVLTMIAVPLVTLLLTVGGIWVSRSSAAKFDALAERSSGARKAASRH